MKKAIFSTAVAFVLVIAAPGARADTIPCPERKVGESFTYEDDEGFGKKTSQTAVVKTVQGDSFAVEENGELRAGRSDLVFGPKAAYYLPSCPFSLGETKTFERENTTGGGMERKGVVTVQVAKEFTTVQVPAGTFKVVEIKSVFNYHWSDGRRAGRTSGTGVVEVIAYYAPELGNTVKFESTSKSSRGPLTVSRRELKSFGR